MSRLRLLDLFSGIGGFSLGLERSGAFDTVAFCEVDPFCRAVLAQHWPGVPIYDDVRTLTGDALARDGITVDAICGGFPCQDVSFAGRRAGLEGARSGLWSEYARIIGELRPRLVIVENVPGLLSLGMGTVLGDLSALGYDAVWDCVPASAVGAPHRRDRVWIVAVDPNTTSPRLSDAEDASTDRKDPPPRNSGPRPRQRNVESERMGSAMWERRWCAADGRGQDVADADEHARDQGRAGDAAEVARGRHADRGCEPCAVRDANVSWLTEPDVGRVADGVPARVDRLRSLGNAVLPQIPEAWGRAIGLAINIRR